MTNPILNDPHWLQVHSFLERFARPKDAILAPNDFLESFPGTYHYNITYTLPADHFAFVIFHKGMVTEIELPFALAVIKRFKPVLANEVFVVYARRLFLPLPQEQDVHVQPLLEQLSALQEQAVNQPETYAIAVTTHNRPQSLARSLPQFLALGVPVVVVDDASTPENYEVNQQIADQHQVPLVRIPDNRGLPNAINVGVSYWLADPTITWISYFQDDVDVHPDIFKILAAVQDEHERPLLTGRDASEHATVKTGEIAGYKVLLKRSMPGQHLHAHRHYWSGVLPIPTPYLGAPKPDRGKPGQGADEDWWITAWSPNSIAKRGGYVVCVPGLVRTFQTTAEESTWGNISEFSVQHSAESQVALYPSVADAELEQESSDRPIPSVPGLSFKGTHILVDGYNLGLTSGTGIKTYGTSLIQALKYLDATVDVLLSRGGYKQNKILDEVYFFDNQDGGQNQIKELLTLLKALIQSSAGPFYQAKRRQTAGEFVVKQGKFSDDFLKYAESFNLPYCYRKANTIYKFFKLTTNIHTSEKIDLWHATYPLPIKIDKAKKVTTIHDLIPLRLPYATLDDKERFYNLVRDALKESDIAIAVSEHTKRDILTYFDVDPDRVVVTYQPTMLKPLNADENAISAYLKRFGLECGKYMLFVGAIEPKKNVGRLIDAYASIDTDIPLVIAGKKGWLWEDEIGKISYLFDKESPKKVKLLEYVSVDSLRYLYKGAYCFIFPSLYEGFGLPPLEAMTFGCPVITSNASCLPEVCGNAALYVDPYDVADIKNKMETLLSDRELHQELSQNGKRNADYFSMENYMKRLHSAYTKALG